MQDKESTLGGRLPLLDPEALQGEQKKLYDVMQEQWIKWAADKGFQAQTRDGRLIGPFNPYLYSPGITMGYLQWFLADAHHTTLPKRVHEVVILTVGAIWNSPYELYAHAAVAARAGLSEASIHALKNGELSDDLTHEEQVAHKFAAQLTKEHRVSAEVYQEAESIFGRTGLVDMTYLIGMYLLTCALLNAFEIPAPQ